MTLQHKDEIRIRHMLNHSIEAVEMVKGRTRQELTSNRMLELALVRLVEIIGEAGARVSPSTQESYPGIPWMQIIGMRNRLIHGYDTVDPDVLWETVQCDIPQLIDALRSIIK